MAWLIYRSLFTSNMIAKLKMTFKHGLNTLSNTHKQKKQTMGATLNNGLTTTIGLSPYSGQYLEPRGLG